MYTKHTTEDLVTDNYIIDFACKQIILEMERSLRFANLLCGVAHLFYEFPKTFLITF